MTDSSDDAGRVSAESVEQTAKVEPAPLAATAVALAAKAKDLVAIRDAVVEAAGVAAALWFSYLFVLLYLLVAVGSVTHRDLLYENPVRLPFLNVDLPMTGFFVLGPLLFLVVHAYVLLHFVLLAGKVGVFDTELRAQIADEDVRARLRRQLPSNVFVQFLAGPRETREGVVGFFLRIVAQISLVIGPIALLVLFELQFLPYHHEMITWWQRIVVIIDLGLLWMLWPSMARGVTIRAAWRDMPFSRVAGMAPVSLIPVLLVLLIASFPGEWLERQLSIRDDTIVLSWLRRVLVAGDVDFVGRRPTSLWSNRIVLPSLDVIDHVKLDSEAKIASARETISLRGRHLEGAVLIGATLRKADLTEAHLNNAVLDDADLRNANFSCELGSKLRAELERASLARADLQGVVLFCANLKEANLSGADLVAVDLEGANLRGAYLDGADLRGAILSSAQLQGASLRQSQLQGAALGHAHLLGANLQGAYLQGASLEQAELQGADLRAARLEGAWVKGADLSGATLYGAHLGGTILDGARLLGAELRTPVVEGALFREVVVWRADPRMADWQFARIVDPETGPRIGCIVPRSHGVRGVCDWSAADFEELRTTLADQLAEARRLNTRTNNLEEALERIEARLDPTKPLEDESRMAERWIEIAATSRPPDVHSNTIAKQWRQTGCAAKGAPYVIQGLLRSLDQLDASQVPMLARDFLDERRCPGALNLSEDAKAKLRAMANRDPGNVPQPETEGTK